MIVFALVCTPHQHRFDGWFGSSADYADQAARGLLCCPLCGTPDVRKAPMAANLARKGNQAPATKPLTAVTPAPELQAPAREALAALAKLQHEALKGSRYVGPGFAEGARAIHYGEKPAEMIHGEATLAEARELIDEGIGLMPLPFPTVPPDQAN